MPNYNSRKERKRAEEEILNKIQTLETDNQQEISKSNVLSDRKRNTFTSRNCQDCRPKWS